MIKSAMRQALRETLMGMKKGQRDNRAKSYFKSNAAESEDEDEHQMEIGEASNTDYNEEDPQHEKKESKKEMIAEGEEKDESWREEQKKFMKNKSRPNKSKTAIVIAVPGPSKKFGKANFAKKG